MVVTWSLHEQVARALLQTCVWLYQSQPSGLGPERVVFSTEEGMRLEQQERERRARDGGPLLEDQANDVAVVDRVTDAHSNPCTVCNHGYTK